jgi:hypothetical protein
MATSLVASHQVPDAAMYNAPIVGFRTLRWTQLNFSRTVMLAAFTIALAVAVHLLYKHHTEMRARRRAPPSRFMNLYVVFLVVDR